MTAGCGGEVRVQSRPPFMRLIAAVLMSSGVAAGGERAVEMRNFLRNDCGACHGMTLQGGLGPALTPVALTGRSAEELRLVIRDGRSGTAMPQWRGQLSDADIDALVEILLTGDEHELPARSGK